MSRMLRILSNPHIKLLHPNGCKIVIIILETFGAHSSLEFYNLIVELILALEGKCLHSLIFLSFPLSPQISAIFTIVLQDLNDFDKEFFDDGNAEAKVLRRFVVDWPYASASGDTSNATINEQLNMYNESIAIGSPSDCSHLQENIT